MLKEVYVCVYVRICVCVFMSLYMYNSDCVFLEALKDSIWSFFTAYEFLWKNRLLASNELKNGFLPSLQVVFLNKKK